MGDNLLIFTIKLCCILFVILLRIKNSNSIPFKTKSNHDRFWDYNDDVQNYLMEYGYLPKSNIETGNLRTESQLRDAIKNLQKFGNIPETGIIDDKTKKLMNSPRCGVSDNMKEIGFTSTNLESQHRSKRYAITGAKWDHLNLTWSLVNQTMSKINSGHVRRVLYEALKVWQSNSKLTFQETNSDEADLQILFASKYHGDGYDFDGPGSVLAHAFYPGPERGGDVHFDSDETWLLFNEDEESGTSLLGVAIHEFGHALGLSHSSVEGAIMFPWYNGYDPDKDLPEDDLRGLEQIYGPKEDKQWGDYNPRDTPRQRPPQPPPRTTTTTRRTTTTTTTTTTRAPQTQPTRRTYYYTQHPTHRREQKPTNPRYEPNDYPNYKPRCTPSYYYTHDCKPIDRNPTKKPYYIPPQYTTRRSFTLPTTTRKPIVYNPNPEKPNGCDMTYDAITIIRGEIFIFKNKYLWRFHDGGLYEGYPSEISRQWRGLPDDFTHVDAVYENKKNQIVFFIGKQYYVFNPNVLEPGYPKPLTALGLPASLNKIDAALVWGHNNRTYFYSNTMYWRFDEYMNYVELDYPRDMSMWAGIGYNIDSAFQFKDGKTYFFKGKGFWKFDDYRMHVAHTHQKLSAHHWMRCPRTTTNDVDLIPKRREPYTAPTFDAHSTSTKQQLSFNLAAIFIILFCYKNYY